MMDREMIEAIYDATMGDAIDKARDAYDVIGPPPFDIYEHQIRTAFILGFGMGVRNAKLSPPGGTK